MAGTFESIHDPRTKNDPRGAYEPLGGRGGFHAVAYGRNLPPVKEE